MAMDIKGLSYKELKKLRTQVDRAMKTAQARERRAARKAAEQAASAFGFSLAELAGDEAPKKRGRKPGPKAKKAAKAGKPKYANPADKSQTWTGKGRQPVWYKDAIDAGKSPGDLAI